MFGAMLALLSFCFVATLHANTKVISGNRYRAMVEYSATGTSTGLGIDSYSIGCFTSHGYQINPHVYVGAGFGLQYYSCFDEIALPLFTNFRADFLKTRVTPYVDAKIGYSPTKMSGWYCSQSLGVRIGLSKNVGFNISTGYVMQRVENLLHTHSVEFRMGIDF